MIETKRLLPISKRVIYSLCDYSEEWPKPYKDAGYPVITIDIKRGKDVRLLKVPDQSVYGVLCAPPCDHFAGSGAQWWKEKDNDGRTIDGLSIVDACLRFVLVTKPVFWALENPVGRLRDWIGEPSYYFDPYEFGDPYTKKTCLWGDFIPPMPLFVGKNMEVEPTEGSKMWLKYGGKSERTKTARSITPGGFARAFFLANQ